MNYSIVTKDNENFKMFCDYCAANLVAENLKENGGTLLQPNGVYQSDTLILALDNEEIVGFIGLVAETGNSVYINQVVVKCSWRNKGVGKTLINKTIRLAVNKGLDITCHIRSYNLIAQNVFTSLGFEIDENKSRPWNSFYIWKLK